MHDVRLSLGASEVETNIANHLWLVLGSLATYGIGLDILIEQFVRIQLGTIVREKEQADVTPMSLDPPFDFARTMHRMTIYDQKDLAGALTYEPTQERDHDVANEILFEDHEGQTAAIGDGGNHVAAKAFPGAGDRGRLSFPPVGRACVMIAAQAHLVAPVNLRMFGRRGGEWPGSGAPAIPARPRGLVHTLVAPASAV